MSGLRLGLTLAVAFGGAGLAQAASPGSDPSAGARMQLDMALSSIQFARCGNEGRCAPATKEEIAAPPLTIGQATEALERGTLSGIAKVCGLPWIAKSFQPMMEHERSLGMNDRQLALIGILHGAALAQTEASIGSRPCSDKLRRDVETRLSTIQ